MLSSVCWIFYMESVFYHYQFVLGYWLETCFLIWETFQEPSATLKWEANERWIPGISRGLHCCQPQEKIIICLWLAKLIPTTHLWASCLSIRHTEVVSTRKNIEGVVREDLNYSTQMLFHKLKECGYEDHKEPCDPINSVFTMAWMLTPGNRSTSLPCAG